VQCGQKADTRRIDWHWLLHEVQHSILHVDKGLLYTLKELFVRPGITIRGFLEGKRVNHFRPVALIMILAAVYSLGFQWMARDVAERFLAAPGQTMDSAVFMETFMSYYAFFELCTVPFYALWTWLLMRKYGHNYTEHLIINSFLGGQRIAINVLTLPLNLLGTWAALAASMVAYVAYLIYFVFGFAQLYEQRDGAGKVVRPLVALMLFWFSLAIVIIGFAFVYALTKAKAEGKL
jgi:hypothetical protein